jgi:hypothetical protein
MGKLWITFFFTVMWLPLCGFTFLLGLVCLGLCLKELSIYLLVGGSLEGQGVLRFGRWCLSAFSGVFERKKSYVFQRSGEFYGGYFSFIFSYDVSVDGGLCVTYVD